MGRSRGVQRRAENVAEAGGAHAELESVHEAERTLARIVFPHDGNQRAAVRRTEHALQFFLGLIESRIVDALYARIARELVGDDARVRALAFHAQRQRLDAARDLVRFEGPEDTADELHHADQGGVVSLVTNDD